MVHQILHQPVPRIRDLYHGVLDRIMIEHNTQPLQHRPSHMVNADASFREVVQKTDWDCWRADSQPYYRYRRYHEILQRIRLPSGNYPVVHVDIGCGAGLFSWAFVDWARDAGIGYDRVALCGFDHSSEMINLAHQMRAGLLMSVANYPDLHYTHNAANFLPELTELHRDNTIYVVTFGHVLVQAQSPEDIANFTRVITHIFGMDAQSRCVLAAIDAKGWSGTFASGWSALLTSLTSAGIQHKLFSAGRTNINDDSRAKIAVLSQVGGKGK